MGELKYFQAIISISDLLITPSIKDDLIRRLMSKSMPEPNTGCWFWIGDSITEGYGRTSIKSRKVLAHRASYECFVGKIPQGFTIDHICKQPSCINPQHLEAVTMYENNMRGDSFSKANALKTQCPKGHEYTFENTFFYKNNGRRDCRICMKERGKKKYALNREKILAQNKERRNAEKRKY